MTTDSYPAVGEDGLDEVEWLKMMEAGDGILNDYTATGGFALSRINVSNTARILTSTAVARIDGYHLEVTADEDLTVSTAAGTYYIAVKYDPALNVADGDGDADPLGPCRLVIGTSLSTAGGEKYLLLYKIVRAASQALSDAALTDYRQWVGPQVSLPFLPSDTPTGFGPWPRGTRLTLTDASGAATLRWAEYIRWPNSGATALEWRNLTAPTAVALSYGTGLAASADGPAEAVRVGSRVHLQGTVKRANNGNVATVGSDVTLCTLATGYRPPYKRGFVCLSGGGDGQVRIFVNTNGTVVLPSSGSADQDSVTYVDLSAISFQI